MLQCVRNKLKTADEKLRSIGKQQHQSATVVQTQNFTYYKHQRTTEEESAQQTQQLQQQQQQQPKLEQQQQQQQPKQEPQQQRQQIPLQQQQQQQQQPQQRLREETAAREAQQIFSDPESQNMAERAIARQGRRDRNGFRAADELERSELKRRSRSEGPSRRVRQSMDEREGGKKLIYDGGGRGRRQPDSSESDDSDRTPRQTLGCAGRFDSDSDSDPKKWTKNPLVVRRVKKSEKTRQAEKRLSGTENGKNRDSWVYYGNEDASSGSLGGSSSRDGGSGSKGSSKYQKLEEMRKKRINLAVTSDEENTPASRISRLRQRAIQSGLGEQTRSANTQNVSAPASENVQWGDVQRQLQPLVQQQQKMQPQQQQQPNYSISSGPGPRKFPVTAQEVEMPRQAAPARPLYGPKIIPMTPQPSFASQSYSQPAQNLQPAYTSSVRSPSQNFQPVSRTAVPVTDLNRGVTQQPSFIQQRQSVTQQSPSQKQAPARPPPPNVSGARQSFHTIPEPSLPTTRALYNSSPEVTNRRYTTQVRIPSADSILDTTPKTTMTPRMVSQPMTLSQTPLHIQARSNPQFGQGLSHSTGTSRSPSQFNDVVEMRLKSTRDERPKPQQKIAKKTTTRAGVFSNSDDSLDELIESNIQYLDSEIDKAKSKKSSSSNVSRSSSLPDPRRMSGHAASAPSLHDQPSIQVQASTSIQFHVSLPTDTRHVGNQMGPPVIQIGPSSAVGYQTNYSYDNQLRSQPDVVPRKYSYDSHARISRPNSEYYDRDDLSKSDSQLNAQVVVPSYLSNSLHPEQAYARGCVSDINLRTSIGTGNTLQSPQMDKGMFSDVEYDIEVSERVKKWETKMKQDTQTPSDKKNQNLTTIQENETEALMLPSEVRKSVMLSKQGDFGSAYPKELTYTPPTRPRPFSSDTSIHKSGEIGSPKVFSLETNAHRFFQVIQDPQAGPRLGIQSQSVSSVFQTPITIRPEKTFLSANELRQQMLSNRQPALPITSGPMQATYQPTSQTSYQPALPQTSAFHASPQKESPVVSRPTNLSDLRDATKRGSRYQEELNEISNVKSESVVNLRRRFDTDSMTSEDDQKSVSTASAKLSRPSKQSPSDSVDLSSMLPGYQRKFKDADVWSPNLESTQGVPVSIERVTARTLQTIPFSEDPFWKEIEEMTSFDPNSMAGHLSVGNAKEGAHLADPVRSQHHVELTPPHSSTLPNQPRTNVMPAKERMQRSKSLYTPNITPLSINVNDKAHSNAVSALDEVLDDISKSSMERKQLSPKKRALESDMTASSSSGVSNAPGFKFEGGQFTFNTGKSSADSHLQKTKPFESKNIVQMRTETAPPAAKQPLQFYQQQRQQQQPQQQNRQSQMLPGNVNNYQLDPDLLKQKLLSTGLVVETDTEDVAPEQYRRSSLDSLPTPYKPYSTVATTYTSVTSQSNANILPGEIRKTSSVFTPIQSIVPSLVTTTAVTSKPVKQSGTSALDDIQKALAPFRSTAYQPGPESLYGTAAFETYTDSVLDTTRGPNTKPTSWSYQPKAINDREPSKINEGSASNTSTSRLQQVNESMDDLRDLAQNVERKINVIRTKLHAADEKSLDSILASLKKCNPEAKSEEVEPATFDDYYAAKKSKLSAALSELDRIHDSLELNTDEFTHPPVRGKYKPYRPSKSSDFILTPQPKSEHLRPMQTRISSVFIPGLETKTRKDLDKETESEFDIISKSFQAIVDEVNQTTDMFSRAADRSRLENTAPETQKQTFKITLKPGDVTGPNISPSKQITLSSTEDTSTTKAPPATAPKPQEMKVKSGRFRSKVQDASGEDESGTKKIRSKSVPGLDSNTVDLLSSALESTAAASPPSKTVVPTTTTVTASTATASASTPPPATRQRTRVRPVRDNKIIQDDRAARRDSTEKVLGMPPSPQPSPKVTRKIIYNSGLDLDVKIQPPQMFQDVPSAEASEEQASNQQQINVKQQAQMLEDKNVPRPSESDIKPASIASPASLRKVPPPTAAKPTVRTEISMPAPMSPTKTSAPMSVPSIGEPDKGVTTSQLNTRSTLVSDSSVSSGLNLTSSSASTASINLTPPVFDSSQPKPLLASPKQDVPDSESSSSSGRRGRKRLGMGVAMMLDKFNTGEDGADKLKKRQGTRSAPDLTGSVKEEDDNEAGNDGDSKQTGHTQPKTESQLSPSHLKGPVPQKDDKKTPAVLLLDSKLAPLVKSTVISSLERKVLDPEARAPSSGTSSPQPLSPSNKPPLHPWKRQTSDPDKQSVSDAIADPSAGQAVGSPKVVSRMTKTVGSPCTLTFMAGPDDGSASKGGGESPKSPTKRVRPLNRKIQTGTFSERPHSFHELYSCFERDSNRVQSIGKFRKCVSADAVNSDNVTDKVFRSERNITPSVKSPDSKKDSEVVFKFAMKMKS